MSRVPQQMVPLVVMTVAPIVILYVLVKLFSPWMDKPELEKVAEEVS